MSVEQDLQTYQLALDKSVKLESLKNTGDFSIVEDTINELIASLAGELLNDAPVEHDKYIEIRYKIEGLRSVLNAFATIERNGQQAAASIDVINGK